MTFAHPAIAEYTSEQLFLLCKISNQPKFLEVFASGGEIVYRYGKIGEPELELRRHADQVAYQPWSGMGSSIWEEVSFMNSGYEYLVSGSIDKNKAASNAPDAVSGGVEVLKSGQSIAYLACDTNEIVFNGGMAIMDAKEALGMSWDPVEQMWRHSQ